MKLMVRATSKSTPVSLSSITATLIIMALLLLTLCTFLQGMYSVIIHLVILVLCFLVIGKIDGNIISIVLVSAVPILILLFLSTGKVETTPIAQLGFFLHYISWVALLIAADKALTVGQKMFILRFVILMSIVCNIASLLVLASNSDAARLLAGSATEEARSEFYYLGLGGYGYLYAMVFLTYGAILWLKNSKKKFDKFLLIVYLITNYAFILYASYTLAIIMVLIITVSALTTKMDLYKSLAILTICGILLVIFGGLVLNFGVEIAERLDLPWVVKRLTQLSEAQMTGDYVGLTRTQLYLESLKSFSDNPIFGGQVVGGHAHMLDWLGLFGICAIPAMCSMCYMAYKAYKVCKNRNFITYYSIFFVFSFINTCSSMQIPVIVLFVCPMISSVMPVQTSAEPVVEE